MTLIIVLAAVMMIQENLTSDTIGLLCNSNMV